MLLRDVLIALRKLYRRPGATALALASLALAIGFSTAAFSVVDAYYWRDLAVKDPQTLAFVDVKDREGRYSQINWYEFDAIQQQGGAIAGVVFEDRRGPWVKLADRNDSPITAGVSNGYFDVLGVQAARGRVFHRDTAAEGQVVLSDYYWRTAFGGDLSICGRTVTVGDVPLSVIGVLPPGFSGIERGVRVDLFVPEAVAFGGLRFASKTEPKDTALEPILRLKPGVATEAGRRAVEQALQRVDSAGLSPGPGRKAFLISFTKPSLKPETDMADVFPWLAALVLAIAAANFANLRLVGNLAQRRETGIRLALGAGRASLLRQHLTESLLLAGGATAVGLLLASLIVELAPAVLYAGQRWREYYIHLDARTFAFSAGAMLLVAAVGAVIPLRDSWRCQIVPALQATLAPSASRWLAGLVILQIGAIAAFTDAAGLLWRSRQNVASIRPAMDPGRDMLLVYGSWETRGPAVASSAAQMARELGAIPGVAEAAYGRRVMMQGSGGGQRVPFERPGQPPLTFRFNQVSPNYFTAAGTRIMEGRAFTDADGPAATPVVMVSQSFVRKFSPQASVLNTWARLGGRDRLIVGVVEDGPSHHLMEDIEPFFYFPYAQRPSGDTVFFVHTTLAPARIAAPARDTIRRSNTGFMPYEINTLAQHLRAQRSDEEIAALVSGGLAFLGMALGAAGLFGVTLCAVSRRMREFGVRVAMGATPVLLGRQVIWEALRMALGGVAFGAVLCFAAVRLLRTRLYGVQPENPWIFAAAAGMVTLVALSAALIPARRAARTDPMAALRVE
ncbi:MAG: ABC transporter permease [Acidobacteriia bacterium]|nr:ABC transporter permease [Terriglobia bacterium]